jgi:hypothetical protein
LIPPLSATINRADFRFRPAIKGTPSLISSIFPGGPRLQGQTNKDLAAHVLELREALRLANSAEKALRE